MEATTGTAGQPAAEASSRPAARAPAAAAGDPEEEEAMVALMGAGWEAAVAAKSVL